MDSKLFADDVEAVLDGLELSDAERELETVDEVIDAIVADSTVEELDTVVKEEVPEMVLVPCVDTCFSDCRGRGAINYSD